LANLDFSNPNGCWIWKGIVNSKGYGAFHVDGKRMTAVHRYLFQQFYRPLGRKEHVLHKCDTPRCCNMAHLYLGNAKDNMADMYRKNRQGAKLDADSVRDIRSSQLSRNELAAKYGVGYSAIWNVQTGRKWKHVQ
jgi:hypothetical protein